MKKPHNEEQLNDELLDPRKGLFNWLLRLIKGLIHSDKKIGEMNGKWAALFRVVLVLVFLGIPALGTWTIWMTKGIWHAEQHIEATAAFEDRIDLLEKNAVILERVDKRVNEIMIDLKNHPNPNQIKDQVDKNAESVKTIMDSVIQLDKRNTEDHNKMSNEFNTRINELEKANATDHATLKTTLDFIKEKVSK